MNIKNSFTNAILVLQKQKRSIILRNFNLIVTVVIFFVVFGNLKECEAPLPAMLSNCKCHKNNNQENAMKKYILVKMVASLVIQMTDNI